MADPRDLCDLEDVGFAHRTVDPDDDELGHIADLITDASIVIMRFTGRRFAPRDAEPTERVVEQVEPYLGHLRISDLSAPPAEVALLGRDGVQVEALAAGAYTLLPRDRAPEEPFTSIRLARTLPTYGVRIVGRWGWPKVPRDARRACVATVTEWLTAEQAGGGQAPEALEGAREPRALPGPAVFLLRPFQRPPTPTYLRLTEAAV